MKSQCLEYKRNVRSKPDGVHRSDDQPRRYMMRMIRIFARFWLFALTLPLTNAKTRLHPCGAERINTWRRWYLLGVGYIFRSVFVLTREVAWLRYFRAGQPSIIKH